MPLFFDLSSLIPTVERNPFEPVIVPDEVPIDLAGEKEEIAAEPIVDTGLPIPSHYDFDMMRALVQDPFRLFVYWQLKDNPFDRLARIFPKAAGDFHTVLKLIDETNNIAVFFQAAFTREYWFQVFPDRTYRVELGVRSPQQGYIRLLSSQSVRMPRGGPSDQIAEEPTYRIAADAYLQVLRESHLVPERAFTLEGLLPVHGAAPAAARNEMWEALPPSFRRLMLAIADIQAGREYDRWWERLSREELSSLVQEFLGIVREMGDGEVGYMLLLRYLPELLRRSIQSEREGVRVEEIQIDKPIALYIAEKLGQTGSSEQNVPGGPEEQPSQPPVSPGEISHGGPGLRIPSMSL